MLFTKRNLTCAGLILAAIACGKTKDSVNDSPRGTGDDGSTQEIQVGQEFSFGGWLTETDSGYRLVRHFTFSLPAEQDLRLRRTTSSVSCTEGDLKENSAALTDASNTLHRSTVEAEGFTLVAKEDFPGKLGGNAYTLTTTLASDQDCWGTVYYVLEPVKVEPKAEPKPEPKPQPKPEPKPQPKPEPSIDAAFTKNWVFEQLGLVRDELHVAANGKATEKVWVQGELFVDLEMDIVTDLTSDPDHVQMTVTKVNFASPDAEVAVGDVSRCIYKTTSSTMKSECGEDSYPTAFTTEATFYELQ